MPVNCVYDKTSGTVSFSTTHFSKYALAYNKVSFDDVNDWAKDYITKLAAMNIISGKGNGKFAPLEKVTRAQFTKMLFGLSGLDNSALKNYKKSKFKDVANTDWCEPYVMWAYKNNIVTGVGNGKFAPNDVITREQMSAMLYKFIKARSLNITASSDTKDFADGNLVSSWAKDAVAFILRAQIINGRTNGKFDPQGTATREEAAKIIAMVVEKSAE